MGMKSPEDMKRAFEHYQKDLNQLLHALKTGGKSRAAIYLMQSLATQDIGMLSCCVPAGAHNSDAGLQTCRHWSIPLRLLIRSIGRQRLAS